MKIIKEVRVVQSSSAEAFRDTLMGCVNRLQERNLEVNINNPRIVAAKSDGLITTWPFRYMAVVEGSTNINPEFLKKRK